MTKEFVIKSKFGYDIDCVSNGVSNPKQAVLILHGFGGDKWGEGFSKLKKTYEDVLFISFNCIGHGKSTTDTKDMTIEKILNEINEVVEFIRSQTTAPLTILGSSFGGYRAMLYANKFPNKINRVILINPALKMLHTLEKLKGFKLEELKPDDVVYFKKSQNKILSHKFLNDLKENNLFEIYKTFKFPCKIFVGTEDDLIEKEDLFEFEKLNNSKIQLVKDGHCLENTESWQEVVNELNKEF